MIIIPDRYQIKEKIASGGMATVYHATDTLLKRSVALKVIHPHLLENPHITKRFENEARAIASLSHENIINLFDYGKTEGSHFLVMELVNGKTLQQLIGSSGIPNLVLLEIFHQIFSGLSAAHSHGIYHRDIKPSNIMVDANGTVKIMDFGIAHLVNEESMTMTGTFIGSPNYTSPEQAAGTTVSDKSDVFSAGSVMYECATGKLPYEKDKVHAVVYAILYETPISSCCRNSKLLLSISDIITRLMEKDVATRPDAALSAKIIKELFESEKWVLSKSRVAEFIKEPERYAHEEEHYLWEHFRLKAHSSYKRFPVTALKSFSQAQAFQELASDDKRLIKAIRYRKQVQKLGALAVGVILLSIIGFLGWQTVKGYMFAHAHPLKSAPLNAVSSVDQLSKKGPVVEQNAESSAIKEPSSASENEGLGTIVHDSKAKKNIEHDNQQRKKQEALADKPVEMGYLQLRTNPPWAAVTIDGLPVGVTPLLIPLRIGDHQMSIKKEGCAAFQEQLLIRQSDTLTKEIVLPRQ